MITIIADFMRAVCRMKNISIKSSPSLVQKTGDDHESGEKLTTKFFGCFEINARTARFRRYISCLMICFPFIPIFALFVQNLSIFLEQINAFDEAREINLQVNRHLLDDNRLINCVFLDFSHGIFLVNNHSVH